MLWNILSLSPRQLLLSSKSIHPIFYFISFSMAHPELIFAPVPFAPCCWSSVLPGRCPSDLLETGLAVNAKRKDKFGPNCFSPCSTRECNEKSAGFFLRVSVEGQQNFLYLNGKEEKETKKVMKVCYLHNRDLAKVQPLGEVIQLNNRER